MVVDCQDNKAQNPRHAVQKNPHADEDSHSLQNAELNTQHPEHNPQQAAQNSGVKDQNPLHADQEPR